MKKTRFSIDTAAFHKFLLLTFFVCFCTSGFCQNYFTGELYEAYDWNLENLNEINLALESDVMLRRRMLSKKEEKKGIRIKENGQYYDQVLIHRKSRLQIISFKDGILTFSVDGHPDFKLQFAANDADQENYNVLVKQLKGDKGVIQYQGLPYRLLTGSRLIMDKLKKKNLPLTRAQDDLVSWTGNGTGILIHQDGYLVTNYHVISSASNISVSCTADGLSDLDAQVILEDQDNDLALLKITDARYEGAPTPLAFSIIRETQDVGTEVFTLGYPMALGALGQEIKYTSGSISSRTGYQDDVTSYQISVPIQAGNSGGPLFDQDGRLLGIVNSKVVGTNVENVGYAVKAAYVISLLESSNVDIALPQGKSDGDIPTLINSLDDYVFMIKIN